MTRTLLTQQTPWERTSRRKASRIKNKTEVFGECGSFFFWKEIITIIIIIIIIIITTPTHMVIVITIAILHYFKVRESVS